MLFREKLTLLVCCSMVLVSALKSQCKGPIRYYKELKCKPIYAEEGDCCAVSYDCTHLKRRSADKCYVDGYKFKVGKELPEWVESGPCDENCVCVKGPDGYAMISCTSPSCPNIIKEGCFFVPKVDKCCANEERRMCEFYGITYKYGEMFKPSEDYACQCLESRTGWNVPLMEMICRKLNNCGVEVHRSMEIRENCPPVYFATRPLYDSCAFDYRCQSDFDFVTRWSGVMGRSRKASDMKCKFGNLTLNVGDELSEGVDYSSERVKCVCEVPPVLTCKKRPYTN
ncbi:uncharacterized protein LOC106646655 isoform X2 [Copidosoma floridanum]|uniref:uncharacterized protein LOC106646655 isoform X2 n=1 Tax=Copidosoma floridanum TaxID=29053 RepID=UPI0006C99167|nr:uncharacterized protein LOC106646655 isoform X2 [Copidosoma floridanum]